MARAHVHIAVALTFAFFADPEGNAVGLSKSVVNNRNRRSSARASWAYCDFYRQI